MLVLPLDTRLYRANQADEMGKPYLTNIDFLKNGVPASIIATIVRDYLHLPSLPSMTRDCLRV